MKNKDLRFNFSLIGLIIYEVALIVFAFDGLSISKLFFTGLVWMSFFVTGYELFKNNKKFKRTIPYMAYVLLIILFFWNVFGVFRSLISKDGTVTTILGNVASALSVLVPFVIVFSVEIKNLKNLYKIFIKVLKLAIPVFCILFMIYGTSLSAVQLRFFLVLFLPVAFLITGLPFYSNKNKVLVLISALLLLYIASLHSVRTMMIREVFLFLGLIAILYYGKYKQKWVLFVSCLALLIPFILLQQSLATGESPFDIYLGSSNDSDLNTDTRTFLYTELFEDLQNTNNIIIGKGANGSYYSPYFAEVDANETFNRNNIEVGVLGLLLKGGLVAVLLNFGILIISIYLSFFKSSNLFVVGIGYILIVHTVLLFLENYIVYSLYNYVIWFFIGAALSRTIRSMSDTEIRMLLQGRIHKR